MKKYWIKDLTENQVIHAPTYEMAKKLCEKFDELGLEWWNGNSYLERDFWSHYGEETCYEPKVGRCWSRSYCLQQKDCETLSFDQILDFEEKIESLKGSYKELERFYQWMCDNDIQPCENCKHLDIENYKASN